MTERYLSTRGTEIQIESTLDLLRYEHVLQRDRDVWVVEPLFPYLSIDEDKLVARARLLDRFPVFSGSVYINNVGDEFPDRMLNAVFIGAGVDAGVSPLNRALAQGRVNGKANRLLTVNHLLMVGMYPFAALQNRFIYVDNSHPYQYVFGELSTQMTELDSGQELCNFHELKRLVNEVASLQEIREGRLAGEQFSIFSATVDRIFEENAKSLDAAETYHLNAPKGPANDFEVPAISKYERRTLNEQGEPGVEVSFALLHYEKALYEFDSLKTAVQNGDMDRVLLHGVYCIMAVGASVDAIANMLEFVVVGQWPGRNSRDSVMKRINNFAGQLARAQKNEFKELDELDPTYQVLHDLRDVRNGFTHGKENFKGVDPTVKLSSVMASVREDQCRKALMHLRIMVGRVYGQLKSPLAPIVVDPARNKMPGGLEVP